MDFPPTTFVKIKPLRQIQNPLLAALMLMCTQGAQAQSSAGYPAPTPTDAAQLNEEVLRAWEQKTGQGAQIAPAPSGGTKIQFTGSVVTDVYHNNITPPPGSGNLATPVRSGTFGKTVAQMDLRGTSPEEDVTHLQASITASNDRSVLSRYPNQLTNLQFGRAGKGYQISGGDVSVNYSQLGSALGLRGIQGSRQFGDLTASAFGGVVADSWEALMDRNPTLDGNPARQRFLRNVYGGKIDYALSQQMRVFATAQAYNDQDGSLPAGQTSNLLAASARAASTGFTYQEGAASLNGEAAKSHFSESTQTGRSGNAFILHGAYKLETLGLRAGTNRVSPNFSSLAQAVPPGVRDIYAAADWTAASWVTLSTELRSGRTTTPPVTVVPTPVIDPVTQAPVVPPAPPPAAGSTSTAQSWTNRANLNLDQYWKGGGLQLSNTATRGTDAAGFDLRSSNTAVTVTRNLQPWTASFGLGWQNTYTSANPTSDSRTPSAQATLAHTWSDGASDNTPTWSFTLGSTATWSHQSLINTGTSSTATGFGLTAGGQLGKTKLNAAIQWSTLSRPTDGVILRTTGLMLDATHAFTKDLFLKIYVRDNLRNDGDVTLRTREQTIGAQLGISW